MSTFTDTTASRSASFYWYDLETTGTNPRKDRILQFAGIRTDRQLKPIAEPDVHYVRIPPEVIPDPEAVLITRLAPTRLQQEGIPEWQLMRKLQQIFAVPDTCIAGYNNVRFDDEFLRYGFFRFLFPPYAHEFKNNNSRFDLLNVVRLTCALRPDGMGWPKQDGVNEYRLETIAAANDIEEGQAHDAAADVRMTIAVARLIARLQPKLWDFVLRHRDRQSVQQMLDPRATDFVLHVDGAYSNQRSCIAPVLPLVTLPGPGGRPSNKVVVVDLARDISMLVDATADEIREELFAKSEEREPGWQRPPLHTVATNRLPVVVPKNTLRDEDAERLNIDRGSIEANCKRLLADSDLAQRISSVYRDEPEFDIPDDPEERLYDGFLPNRDDRSAGRLWRSIDEGKEWPALPFEDPRARELARRLKARAAPSSLTNEERRRHRQFIAEKLLDADTGIDVNRQRLRQFLTEERPLAEIEMLMDLERYIDGVAKRYVV